MSDEIIARIEAPRAARELAGHADAAATLAAAWSGGRFAHAWLIVGPQGIGKATLAWRFARFVLARERRPGADPLAVAPDDPAARQVAAGSHPDIRLVRRDYRKTSPHPFMTEISVDNIRDLGPFLHQTAALGGWRAIIVDAADDMNVNAQNALLKLLEEPPAKTAFLLVCHAPARLLPTIRSRCRRLGLPPLPEDTVSGLLERWRGDLDAGERAALARLSHGSIGGALRLADEGGLQLYRDLVKLLQPLPRLDVPAVQALADRLSRNGSEESYRTFVALLLDWLARLVRRGAVGEAGEESVPGEDAVAARLLGEANLEQWLAVWEKISRLAARAEAVELDRKQVVLSAFSWLAAPRNA